MGSPLQSSPYQLRVEGRDDHHCVVHLLRRHGFDWDDDTQDRPYVSYADGKEGLFASLSVAVKGSYERVGFVVDADTEVQDRWAQVRDRLKGAGLTPPDGPDPAGTIISGLRPRSLVGVWLMPDNANPGRLEDFLVKLVDVDDPCWQHAHEATAEAARRGCASTDTVKSTLHAWLAWQQEPGLPFGTALRARVFRNDSEDARRFVAWFTRLFGEEG